MCDHAAQAWPWQQRGRQLWTPSQSPAVAWSSIQGEGQAGSLPFPVQMAYACWRIMGGITSFPAVQSQVAGLLGEIWKKKGTTGWAFSCSSGAQRAFAAAGGCIFLSAATGHVLTGGAVNPRSYSYCIIDSLIKLFNHTTLLVPIISCLIAH